MKRLHALSFAALLLSACNSILGNVDYHFVGTAGGTDAGPAKCQRNSECGNEVCLFATCGRQCEEDRDCATGSRCLKTDTGVACVVSSAATCDAGCPAGTTCSMTDNVCRNACDQTECLAGQTCTNGLCVGTSEHEMGSAGSGGSAASGESCVGKVCDTPPAAVCDGPARLKTHDKTGSCAEGVCSYVEHLVACACQGDACSSDPCSAVTCDSPPHSSCKDAATLTTYAASGTCTEGSCSYEPTDTSCPSNQECGGAGDCLVCKTDLKCGAECAPCSADAKKCKDLGKTSKCVECLSNAECSWPTPSCNPTTNLCEGPPSCRDLLNSCGPQGTSDCCAANLVPGGTFQRGNDASYPATVADFRLDNYEITVGRFRRFVAAYSQNMTAAGAGKNPNNPSDPGWDVTNNGTLPADGMLTAALQCSPDYQTWNDTVTTQIADSLAINCISWFVAQAFCIWDGGRLPTEAEWNYAAAGGAQQRSYPWGSPAPDCFHANYRTSTDYCVGTGIGGVTDVGNESAGDGLYHQADLAGNVWEWTQDWWGDYPPVCNNCANFMPLTGHVVRGGSFNFGEMSLLTSGRSVFRAETRDGAVGARCARAP